MPGYYNCPQMSALASQQLVIIGASSQSVGLEGHRVACVQRGGVTSGCALVGWQVATCGRWCTGSSRVVEVEECRSLGIKLIHREGSLLVNNAGGAAPVANAIELVDVGQVMDLGPGELIEVLAHVTIGSTACRSA